MRTMKNGHVWLCFTPDHDPKQAKERFIQKFGYEPEKVFVADGLLWVGPVNVSDLLPHLGR